MSIKSITCDVCGADMTERITRQLSIHLPAVELQNGRIREMVVEVLAGGQEVEVRSVPNHGLQGEFKGSTSMRTISNGKVTQVYKTKNTVWITVEIPRGLHPLEESFREWLDDEPYKDL